MNVKILKFLKILKIPSIGNFKLGPEDRMSHEFKIWLNNKFLSGELNAVFFHVPNESKSKIESIVKCLIGMVPGAPDWVITNGQKTIFIELKVKGRQQTENQIIFQDWCNHSGVNYLLCKSCDDAKNVIRKYFMELK